MTVIDLQSEQAAMRQRQRRHALPPDGLSFLLKQLAAAETALTVAYLAKLFALSEQQIYKLNTRLKDPMPGFYLEASLRFDPEAVAGWLRREVAA